MEGADSLTEIVLKPIITGLSPKEGVPGTQIKIRGENLGKSQNDIVALSICGADCLVSARWKSPSLIIASMSSRYRKNYFKEYLFSRSFPLLF